MLRMDFDPFSDGFVIWDDPMLDLQGDLVSIVMLGVFFALPVIPLFTSPEGFAPAALSLLLGLLILLSCSSRSSLIFLLPFAVPLLAYGWGAANLAMMRYSTGMVALMLAICSFGYVALVILGIGSLTDNGWITGLCAVFAFLTWGCVMFAWGNDFTDVGILEPVLDYTFYAAAAASAGVFAWWVFQLAKGKVTLSLLALNGGLFLLGLAILMVAAVVASAVSGTGDGGPMIASALLFLTFLLAPFLIKKVLSIYKVSVSGSCTALLFPVLLCVVFALAPSVGMLGIDCDWMDALVTFLAQGPVASFFRFLAQGLVDLFSVPVNEVFHAIVRGWANLINHSIPYESVGGSVVLCCAIAILVVALMAGERLSGFLMKKFR